MVKIHWFRRDLRVTDNTSLAAAAADGADVVPVYVISGWRGAHRWTGPMRQEFLCGCLRSLDANLRGMGSRLIIREGDPVEGLLRLAGECGAAEIHFNRDPDPHGREVERRLAERAGGRIGVFPHKDACLHERDEVLTATGEPFRVFTPYSRAWAKLPKEAPRGRPRSLGAAPRVDSLPLPDLGLWGLTREGTIIEPGEKAARARLATFVGGGLAGYGENRDIPAGRTTSRLSQDLRFGLVSIREVFAKCREKADALAAGPRASAGKYESELIWREFYMSVLWHFPQVLEEEFNPVFRGMRWPGKPADFARWCAGETGFPIVDAAMRQLNATGFMHNRTRMIAAMFLTKDLQLDWRMGESYFLQKLVDGEIASNNGGWQWSAGTGADAAPYFRIQNPWTQTARYDADGRYIKEWIPELRDVPAAALAAPPEPGKRLAPNYPPPMVDHTAARDSTLELFASWKARS